MAVRLFPVGGFALALAGYTFVHVSERKGALILAAAAAFWEVGCWPGGSPSSPPSSARSWDLAVVMWFSFRGRSAAASGGPAHP